MFLTPPSCTFSCFTYSHLLVLYLYVCKNFIFTFRLDNDRRSVETSRIFPIIFTSICLKKNCIVTYTKCSVKDVRAHCYCASLVRTLFIGHARATSFSSARTESKTQQNQEAITRSFHISCTLESTLSRIFLFLEL